MQAKALLLCLLATCTQAFVLPTAQPGAVARSCGVAMPISMTSLDKKEKAKHIKAKSSRAATKRFKATATGKLLRWNHFGRKNLGFLYAVQHGARWVYDTDDDNELQSMAQGIPIPRPNALVDEVATSFKLYNLYPQTSTVRARTVDVCG